MKNAMGRGLATGAWGAALGLLLILAVPARAAFEDTGAGARAPGLGNAFTAMADDLYAIYYNPAGLALLERPELGTSYSQLFMGLSDNSNISNSFVGYAQPLQNGRNGTLGAAWNSLTLNGSLYREDSYYLSYGRRLLLREDGGELLGGLSAKYLEHSFGTFPEASNAWTYSQVGVLPTQLGVADPDMAKKSKTAYDADLGLIYRFPKQWQLGLAVMHAMQPDVGFASSDKLQREIHLGAAWKSLWMSLSGEVQQVAAPTGGTDRDVILAAERYFPTLTMGQFGLRGALGFGSRDFEQVSVGLSYRINKLQLDYAFVMPIGTVQGTEGTQRVSLTWHFGAPAPEEEITKELLEQARQMREGGPSYGYEYSSELRPQSIDDARLADVRRLIEGRYYRKAHEALGKFIIDQTPNSPLMRLANRLELVSYYYADWSGPRSRVESVAVSAIYEFLRGHDRRAILKGAYAYSLDRNDTKFDHFLTDMENAVGIKAERLAADNTRSFVDEMLARVEAANSRREFQTVDLILQDLMQLDDDSASTVEKVGSMYYMLGRYAEAVSAWTKALAMEKSEAEKSNLQYHIALARERMGLKAAAPAPAAPAAAVTAPAASAEVSSAAVTAPAVSAPVTPAPAAPAVEAPAAAAPAKPARTADVERLYQKGVEHYSRGEYLQATAMFMRILQIDPSNALARKALATLKPQAAASSLTREQIQKLYDSGIDHYVRGENAAAKKDFQAILRADPDNEDAKKALRRINEAAQ
jgi:tetratricopeptide (TPR) repeat protein